MKKYLAALSATALIGIAPYALAAPSTDLTVIGTITPNACTPTVSNFVRRLESGQTHEPA
jgi:hypothetical protein